MPHKSQLFNTKEKAEGNSAFSNASGPGLPDRKPREEEQSEPRDDHRRFLTSTLLAFRAGAVRVVLLPVQLFDIHPFRKGTFASPAFQQLHRFLLREGCFPSIG